MLLNDVELEDLVQSGVYVFGSLDQNVKTKEDLFDLLVDGSWCFCCFLDADAGIHVQSPENSEHQDHFHS